MNLSQRWTSSALLGVSLALSTSSIPAQSQFAPSQPIRLGLHTDCDEIAFSRDGCVLMTRNGALLSTTNPQIRFWDVASHKLISTIPAERAERLDAHGKRFLLLKRGSSAIIGFVTPNDTRRLTLNWKEAPDDTVFDADWSKDGKEVWLLSPRRLLQFNASTGTLLRSLPLNTKNYEWLAGDGEHLLSISLSTKADLLSQIDVRSGALKIIAPRLTDEFSINRVSRDLRFYWTNSFEGQVRAQKFFRLRDNKLLWTWKNHSSTSTFSSDGRLVLSFDRKSALCIARDSVTGNPLWRFKGPDPLAFTTTPDARILAESRRDGQVLLWPLSSLPETHFHQ